MDDAGDHTLHAKDYALLWQSDQHDIPMVCEGQDSVRAAFQHVQDSGVEFAEVEDAGRCLLRILSDSRINGRSLFIAARKWSPSGYLDPDLDGLPDWNLIREIQTDPNAVCTG